MGMMRKIRGFVAMLAGMLALNSCVAVSADIVLKNDGSGTAVLKYRMDKRLEALGRLDGSGRWFTAPVGRADFERSVKRLPGVRMRSFSSREGEKDLVVQAGLEFDSLEAFLKFLDGAGSRAVYAGEGGIRRLTLVLGKARELNPGADSAFHELFSQAAADYGISLSFTLPGEGEMRLLDTQGRELPVPSGAVVRGKGKKVSCEIPLAAALEAEGGLALEVIW